MNTHFTFSGIAGILLLLLSAPGFAEGNDAYGKAILSIGKAIEALKGEYPQLRSFSVRGNANKAGLYITYNFNTHQPAHRAGWAGAVPNPDANGIWFYIDFHDPDSPAQIHTQPVTAPLYFGKKRVSFLILEGNDTKPVSAAISRILNAHGVTTEESDGSLIEGDL